MTALSDFIERLEPNKELIDYRKDLVSPRGTIFSGALPDTMNLSTKRIIDYKENEIDDSLGADDKKILKIFLSRTATKTNRAIPGFIFTPEGTSKLISRVSNEKPIFLYDDFRENLLFGVSEKASLWSNSSEYSKKRLIKDNMSRMIKETDIQYRLKGDRLHYLVIGKIITRSEDKISTYPLFCFSCNETSLSSLSLEISDAGFVNFVFDEKLLDSAIYRIIGSNEISIDNNNFPILLDKLKYEIEKLSITDIDSIEVDTSYSMIGVITGFETEYLDKAWDKLLNE